MKEKKSNIMHVEHRRKREGKTDYRKRITLLKSGKNRIVIRKSLNNITAQIVKYETKGDVILASAHSSELKKYGLRTSGGNIPVAYLVGLLIGKKAINKGIMGAIADIGLNQSTKGSRIYAVVKGAVDAGLKIPVTEDVLPSKDRIDGKALGSYAKMLEEKKIIGPFSEYHKAGIKPDNIQKYFDDIKKRIIEGK